MSQLVEFNPFLADAAKNDPSVHITTGSIQTSLKGFAFRSGGSGRVRPGRYAATISRMWLQKIKTPKVDDPIKLNFCIESVTSAPAGQEGVPIVFYKPLNGDFFDAFVASVLSGEQTAEGKPPSKDAK